MTSFIEETRRRLDAPWITFTNPAVPCGLGTDHDLRWRPLQPRTRPEDELWFPAMSEEGLEASFRTRFFEDTRGVECWGSIRNAGSEPVLGVTSCSTLDATLGFPLDFGAPLVRCFRGAVAVSNFFPPDDFRVVDRRLIEDPPTARFGPALSLGSLSDGRTSGEYLPCVIVCDQHRTRGLALFLEWSGLWRMSVKRPSSRSLGREHSSGLWIKAGIEGLGLDFLPGEELPLPRLLVVAFDGDLSDGGNAIRRHVRRHVAPTLADEEVLPPTSFNHWFGFGNDFDERTLLRAADSSARAGLEYFCVDGGWYKGGFRRGVGNWQRPDPAKLPNGLEPLSRFVSEKGMKFGLWFEPEWANEDSDLYREHPEWFWRSPPEVRLQDQRSLDHFWEDAHLLNLGLAEARQWWLDLFMEAYERLGMRWVRWDFNQIPRPNWEHGVPDGRVGWRQIQHVTGFYRLLDELMEACPDLFVEQCASGAMRIDLGTVRRGHSFWMNDHSWDSDVVRELQCGLNAVLPGNYANTNLCQWRHDYTDYDYLSHGAGGFGYSGALWEASREDFARYAEAVSRFKDYRHILMGDYHRLADRPASPDDYSGMLFEEDGEQAVMEFNLPGARRSARLIRRAV